MLLAVGFLFAAVVLLLVVFVFGPAHGPLGSVEDQQTQLRHLRQERLPVGRPAGGKEQLAPGHGVDLRGGSFLSHSPVWGWLMPKKKASTCCQG